MNIIRIQLSASLLLVAAICWQNNSKKAPSIREHSTENMAQMLIDKPNHGYVSNLSPSKWEEAMLTGNGTLGALVMGYPMMDRIIFSHEKLFLPENPPTNAPDFGGSLELIRELILKGETQKANELSLKLGEDVGLAPYYWTNPFIPACQMDIEVLNGDDLINYTRSVDFESGEASYVWSTKHGRFKRSVFSSRSDGAVITRFSVQMGKPFDFRIRLSQLPVDDSKSSEEGQGPFKGDVIEDIEYIVNDEGTLRYTTRFAKQWAGSLKGYTVETIIGEHDGSIETDGEWLYLKACKEITLLTDISLSYELPVSTETKVAGIQETDYKKLLKRHKKIHADLFNRFSIRLDDDDAKYQTPEQLINSSSFGNLNNRLVEVLCEAARYILISSTGEIPPTLVGIWGGTWKPAWSGDFTLNGNVPSVLAGGLNTNFPEIIESYIDYMWSMMDDFRDNARDLFGAPGIFVPSRSSDFGKTYHYGSWHPHLFWFAGGAWTAHIFYDYWQYTGDQQFLKEKAIPFMVEAIDFLEYIVTEKEDGTLMFIPSYSPEVGPLKDDPKGHHNLAINATMDVASMKQLLRNLLKLVDQGLLESEKIEAWSSILSRLPDYEVDETGDLKEWIWPDLRNNNRHRHASHLYPLFYEPDPAFLENPELRNAAVTAIENRLSYRRDKNGAEMAFGLVQLGLAAAHVNDVDHAYECVDWLCNSYWSPAFTAYHDPGRIFNVDICGGLPALVTEMIIQSSAEEIMLLPALPDQWSDGEVKGVLTRCGVMVDLKWKNGEPVSAVLHAQRNTSFELYFRNRTWKFDLSAGQKRNWTMNE